MEISKLLFLLCILYFYNSVAMELMQLPPQETDRTLEALSLAIPNYPKYTNLTNYEESYKKISKLINVFDKSAKENMAFSFLKNLKKEYEFLNKQKAKLMSKFDLTSSQKKLQQEKTRLAQLEQQLTEKSKTLEQLAEKTKEDTKKAQDIMQKALGILNENRETKLQLQNMKQQNEQYVTQLKSINEALNEIQQKKQKLETEQLEFKNNLTQINQQLQNTQKQIQSEAVSKSFLQHYPKTTLGLGLFVGSALAILIMRLGSK